MPVFTPGELEVMQVLWDNDSLKPAEIQEKFPRPIRNAALRSVLLVLLEKGHVRRERLGKAYYYSARTRRQGTLRSEMKRMADTFARGSAAGLIAQLIRMEKLSAEEVEQLQRIAEEKKRGES